MGGRAFTHLQIFSLCSLIGEGLAVLAGGWNWKYVHVARSQQKGTINMMLYIYQVIREYPDGVRGKRSKRYACFEPSLRIGGLYVHLGVGFPGLQRVLSMTVEHIPD